MKEGFDNPALLEELYFKLGYDIAVTNDSLIDHLRDCRAKKNELKEEMKSEAQFKRLFDESEEGYTLKTYKYTIEALKHLKSSVRVRLEGLKTELNQ